MEMRKVYIGEMEVDFESLKAGDKCLLVDSKYGRFLIEVESDVIALDNGVLGVRCKNISVQTKTPH